MKKYKVAIFDMDGTILDTLVDLMTAANYALRKSNMPTKTFEEIRKAVGNGIPKLIDRVVEIGTSDDRKIKVLDDFKEFYSEHSCDFTKPYDGILDVMENLKKNNVIIGIVSNKANDYVQDLCIKFFNNLYDASLGGIQSLKNKPAPDMVYYILNQLGVDKEDAVYIGDSEVDIMTAKNSGLDCISCTWGFRDYETITKTRLDAFGQVGNQFIISNPNEILKFFL